MYLIDWFVDIKRREYSPHPYSISSEDMFSAIGYRTCETRAVKYYQVNSDIVARAQVEADRSFTVQVSLIIISIHCQYP